MSLVACSTLAISGYVVFTDKTQGNILNNFSPVSQPSLSGRIAPILTIISIERYPYQRRSILLRLEYVHNITLRIVRLQRGAIHLL